MSPTDYTDPAEEQEWLDEQESRALDYLNSWSIEHDGDLVIEWCVAPYVSVWTTSLGDRSPKTWIICGDLPTDFIKDNRISDAQSAVRAFAKRWVDVSQHLLKGQQHPTIRIGGAEDSNQLRELGDLLRRRADLLLKWSADKTLW
jgi:hypothetical protein